MKAYDHKKIEKKWQTIWDKKKVNQAEFPSKKKKFYGLIEFPYPSGIGLHVGHIRSNTAVDIISRKKRMEGYNVLYPIGWDAFGLPTENHAIKTGIHPIQVTKKNTDTFRKQLKALGFSFDWSREVNTTDPKYYKWTQWIFLQFFKKGLAYKTRTEINWCPSCKIGMANEEVVGGMCERCGGPTEKREKEQWMLAITKYADRLDKDLDTVDYLPKIKIQQRNWIGKSEGVMWTQKVKDLNIKIESYDSVPQTFMAQTYCVIAPEHPLVKKLVEGTKYEEPVLSFVEKFIKRKKKNAFEVENEMEGIFTGRYVDNPFGTGDLPIWIATFVIAEYGTGIVNSSAHDERDFAFAKKYNIPLRPVAERLFLNNDGGPDNFREHEPVVDRDAVVCVIKHWSENKYLCLDWKKAAWKGFVTGGIENGESIRETVTREILEETGFKNIKSIQEFPKVHSKFYQPVKKENRFAHFHPVYVELAGPEQDDISEEEKELYDIKWVSKKEVESFVTRPDIKYIWEISQGNERPIIHNGIMMQPTEFAGREWGEVREDIIEYVIKKGLGYKKVTYKLRDWVFSRQRYWGEPIPLIDCGTCGFVPVSEKDLPVVLPKVAKYKPTDTGESPLAAMTAWVNVKCPKCKGKAKRETDTMPNWAGSSWYFLRYTDPKNNKEFASKKSLEYFMGNGVDWYNGGMEHTTLHLLYSRFWHKFLYDLKLVPTSEPYHKRTSHGLILADDGSKFSKSKGKGVDPMDIIKVYGADTLRLYEMFMGPFDQAVSWDTNGLVGPRRFIERVWKLSTRTFSKESDSNVKKLLHKTIKKVSEDIKEMRFNTAISSMMILSTEMEKATHVSKADFKTFLQILSPFAPHMTEELWSVLGEKKSINLSTWPKWDEKLIKDDEIKIMIQVNGKVRSEIMVPADETEENITTEALKNGAIQKYLEGKSPKKVIYVKNRLVNIVV